MTDSLFSSVSLLLHAEGSDGSRVIVDSSPARRAVTATGAVEIDTAQSRWGSASLLFSGGYLTAPDSADFAPSGAWTIEGWIRPSALTATYHVLLDTRSSVYRYGILFWVNAAGQLRCWAETSADATTATGVVQVGQWAFVAARCTASGTLTVSVNGNVGATAATRTGTALTSQHMNVGQTQEGANYYLGWLDELRFTRGDRAINAVPTAPFNTVPVLVASSPTLSIDVGASATVRVSALLAGATDAEGDPLGIALTATTGAGWDYSINAGATWASVGAVTAAAALLLRPADVLRYTPAAGVAQMTATWRAWDQSAGAAGGTIDASSGGGSSALSAATDQLLVTVTDAENSYATALQLLMPRGPAWLDDEPLLDGASIELARVQASADQLLLDCCPVTTTALITDYELLVGQAPDAGATLAQRRAAVVAAFAARGGQSIGYFTTVAAAAGYTITITECHPFRVGLDGCGDALGDIEWDATWVVSSTVTLPNSLRALLLRLKPAHTYLLFS